MAMTRIETDLETKQVREIVLTAEEEALALEKKELYENDPALFAQKKQAEIENLIAAKTREIAIEALKKDGKLTEDEKIV